MVPSLLTHICTTPPLWDKSSYRNVILCITHLSMSKSCAFHVTDPSWNKNPGNHYIVDSPCKGSIMRSFTFCWKTVICEGVKRMFDSAKPWPRCLPMTWRMSSHDAHWSGADRCREMWQKQPCWLHCSSPYSHTLYTYVHTYSYQINVFIYTFWSTFSQHLPPSL